MLWKGASTLLAALVVAGAPRAESPAGFRKAYFGATKPGAWAKYRMTALGGPGGFTTYTRLTNEAGRQRLQVRSEFTADGEKITEYSDCTLERGYSLEQDALGFGRAIESVWVWREGTAAEELPAEDLADMRPSTPDFAATARFVAAETIAGRTCDRYSYTQKHSGESDEIETGDLWLDETVPFGLVRQTGVTKDASGRFLSRFQMTLVDSGTGATGAARPGRRSAAGPPVKLADAYREGQVELAVEVLAGSSDGSRISVTFKNTSDEALRLTIPSGPTALEVGAPVDTLRFDSASTWLYDIEPGARSPSVELTQTGARRAVAGKFVSSVREGKPLLSGDVTMETVK